MGEIQIIEQTAQYLFFHLTLFEVPSLSLWYMVSEAKLWWIYNNYGTSGNTAALRLSGRACAVTLMWLNR